MSTSAALRARVFAEVARTPAPTRDEHRRSVLRSAGVVALLLVISFAPMRVLVRGERPDGMIAFSFVTALVIAAFLTRVVNGRRGSMLGPSSRRLVFAALVSAPLWTVLTVLLGAWWPDPASRQASSGSDALCALLMLVQGGIPLAAVLVTKRGSDPVHPVLTGVAWGVTAGAWAVTMAYVRCPHASIDHGIVAHVLPTALLAAAGAIVGRRLLAFR